MMSRRTLVTWLMAWPLALVAAQKAGKYADPPMPKYRVDAALFNAGAADIKAVCDSAGRELWRFFPGLKIKPFVVTHGRQGPITLFEPNAQGEIVVRLDTGGTYWCQYSYQFAHEFCHILCAFDKGDPGNKWFEETICETASLFVMRAMAKAWKSDPPFPHWRDYRDELRNYTDDVIARHSRVCEIYEQGLGAFYRAHKAELEKDPCKRDLNGAMAVVFLNLFEQDPSRWEAVRWLNSSPSPKGETFGDYLQKWHSAVPDGHKAFVRQVAGLYGVPIRSGGRAQTPSSPSLK